MATEFIKIDAAADYLGVTKQHLYYLVAQKAIPHYKPNGKTLYFTKEELSAWIAAGRVATAAEIRQTANNHSI